MSYLLEVIIAIICGGIGYWWRRRRIYRDKADKFKELLISDFINFESDDNSLGAVVLQLYPVHNEAFQKFLVYVSSKREKKYLESQWLKYTEIYQNYKSLGVFGAVAAELPHPDFDPTPELIAVVKRKRKKQINDVINEFIQRL